MGVLGTLLFILGFQLGSRSSAWAEMEQLGRRGSRLDAVGLSFAADGQRSFERMQLEELRTVHHYSEKYRISADLAKDIRDIALAEGIPVDLAFELVRVESEFKSRAVSPVGALGYTQLMPATARIMQPGITRQQIFDRRTNLRLGFRFLRQLVEKYDGDHRLALLAYNRGPGRVDQLRRLGVDPSNGYARAILGE